MAFMRLEFFFNQHLYSSRYLVSYNLPATTLWRTIYHLRSTYVNLSINVFVINIELSGCRLELGKRGWCIEIEEIMESEDFYQRIGIFWDNS